MAQFNVSDYLRKHGAKLNTRVDAADGTKLRIPGLPSRMTAAGLKQLAEESSEEAPVSVALPTVVVNGRDVNRGGRIYGDAAGPLVEWAVGKDDTPAKLADGTAAAS